MSFEYLANKYKESTFHNQNIQLLIILVCGIIHKLAPDICQGSFEIKNVKYSHRSRYMLIFPKDKQSNRFGINSILFTGSISWNNLPNFYKKASLDEIFKKRIKSWIPTSCTCNICK